LVKALLVISIQFGSIVSVCHPVSCNVMIFMHLLYALLTGLYIVSLCDCVLCVWSVLMKVSFETSTVVVLIVIHLCEVFVKLNIPFHSK
jgi:hypothetical protein